MEKTIKCLKSTYIYLLVIRHHNSDGMCVEFKVALTFTKENCKPTITSPHLLLRRNLREHLFSTTTDDEINESIVMKCRKRYNRLINNL